MNYLNTRDSYTLFDKAVHSELYVDKSLMIDVVSKRIGTGEQYICITRPRRFGKTMNANMLAAYYSMGCDSQKLFADLEIANSPNYGKNQNTHNVIHIDFSEQPDVCENYRDYISSITEKLKEDLSEAYPHLNGKKYTQLSQMFDVIMETVAMCIRKGDKRA